MEQFVLFFPPISKTNAKFLLLSRKADPPTPPGFLVGDSSPTARKSHLLSLVLTPPKKGTPPVGNILISHSETKRNVNSMFFWRTAGAFLSAVITKIHQTPKEFQRVICSLNYYLQLACQALSLSRFSLRESRLNFYNFGTCI